MKKKTLGIIIVSVPGELQPRAVDVGGADLARGVVLGRVQDGQPLLGSDLLQRHVYAAVFGCQEQQGGL